MNAYQSIYFPEITPPFLSAEDFKACFNLPRIIYVVNDKQVVAVIVMYLSNPHKKTIRVFLS